MYLKSTPVHLHKKVTIRFLSAKNGREIYVLFKANVMLLCVLMFLVLSYLLNFKGSQQKLPIIFVYMQ